jgi:hypothetical protein
MSIQLGARCLLAIAFSASLTSTVLADNAAVVGTWNITIEDNGFYEGDLDIMLEIKETKDGGLTGTWDGEHGDDDLEDVEWDGEELSFVRVIELGGSDLEVEHTAEITGNTLEGEMELPLREIEFTGRRED